MRAWVSPHFLLALLVSLLLHLATIVTEPLLLWLESDQLDALPTLKATQRKLAGQHMASPADKALLAGVKPAEQLTVRLGAAAAPPVEAPPPTPPAPQADTPPEKPKPAKRTGKHAKHGKPPASRPVKAVETASVAVAPTPAVVEVPAATPPAAAPAVTVSSKPAEPVVAAKPPLDGAFPQKVDISYIIKGLVLAEHQWRVEGKRYRIATRGNLLGKSFEMLTEGEIGPDGLKPVRYEDFRDGTAAPKYRALFDWTNKSVQLTESATQKVLPLEDGAQDVFSAAYQFALQGSKLPSFNLQVVTGRNTYQIGFEIKGEAELTLSGEKVHTLVVAGAYEQRRFEFFLAPDWHNLPVRIRYQDGDNVYDLVAVQLALDDKLLLKRVSRQNRDR